MSKRDILLDELFDYDDTSAQSVQDNELVLQNSTSDPAQRLHDDMEFFHSSESSKRFKLDMGDLMIRTNVTKRNAWV